MRILFIILLPVLLYPIIIIYFNKYQDILIKSEFAAIERQGLTLTKSLALAENQYGLIQNNQISSPALQSLIPKVNYGSNIRARLFNMYGNLIADTKASMKYSPFVKVSPLPSVDKDISLKNYYHQYILMHPVLHLSTFKCCKGFVPVYKEVFQMISIFTLEAVFKRHGRVLR